MTRIAVDAMGGDFAPSEIVKGAVWAAQDYNVPIELVGQVDKIQKVLNEIARKGIRSNRGGYFVKRIKVDLSKLDIKLTQADEIIEMGEAVGTAIRKKKNSSIVSFLKNLGILIISLLSIFRITKQELLVSLFVQFGVEVSILVDILL